MSDLISRQAAMEEISKQQTYKMFEGEDTLYLDANDVGSVLASLPSAQSTMGQVFDGDTINRQAAIDALHMHLMYRMGTDSNKKRLDEWINNLPSVQPEIIRCKDCKWYGRADKRRFYRGTDCLNHRIDTIVPDEDYCSRAERRTDE